MNNNLREKVSQERVLPILTKLEGQVRKEGSSSSKFTEAVPYEKALKSSNEKTTKTRDVKCFRCLGRRHIASECATKRITILKDNGEYTSESLASEEDEEEEIEVEPMEGDLLRLGGCWEVNYML